MEVDLAKAMWRKSIRSGQAHDCVEVADNLSGVVAVRDSKDRKGPTLAFTDAEWCAFVDMVKDGRFERH